MKKASFFLVFTLVFSIFVLNAQTGNRHTESSGNFSICPPLNWTAEVIPGLTYRIFMGPQQGNFRPNMNIVDEYYSGSLSEYVSLSTAGFTSIFPDALTILNEPFSTGSGINGKKILAFYSMAGVELCAAQYAFNNENRMYVLTYVSMSSRIVDFINSFDESARTFMFLR